MRISLFAIVATAAGLAAAQNDSATTPPQCVQTCINRASLSDASDDVAKKCGDITDGVKALQCVCNFDKVVDAYQACFETECAGVADAAQLDGEGICKSAGNGAPSARAIAHLPVAAAAGLIAGSVLFF